MNRLYQITYFILLGFILVACNTISPTAVITSDSPLLPISSATATIFPTSTETAFFVTPTFQPEIAAEVATLDAIVTEIPDLRKYYDRFCITHGNCAYVSNLGLSPNKKWAVFFNILNGSAGLSIVDANDNKKQWDISYFDITGDGGGTVKIEHWSSDGHYSYVSPQTEASGGLFWFWRDYIQLIRIDLEDGTWVDTKMGSSYSFSPDENLIAYRHGQALVIHELQSGDERLFKIPTEYVAFGRFEWSQDSKQIIFVSSTVEELDSDEGKPNGFTLFLLDLEKMKAQVILEKDKRYLYPVEWQTPNIILLESLYKVDSNGYLQYNGEQYKLNLGSKEITKSESP